MRAIRNRLPGSGDETSQPEATSEHGKPSFSSYMHMMCFLHCLALRPLFGLPSVNYGDEISKPDAFGEVTHCRCGTSGQQYDAKHVVADLAMKYHRFLLQGYELWDLVPPRNSRYQ